VRKEAGRLLDPSSDIIIKVKGLTEWERREWQGSRGKAQETRKSKLTGSDLLKQILIWNKYIFSRSF